MAARLIRHAYVYKYHVLSQEVLAGRELGQFAFRNCGYSAIRSDYIVEIYELLLRSGHRGIYISNSLTPICTRRHFSAVIATRGDFTIRLSRCINPPHLMMLPSILLFFHCLADIHTNDSKTD
jgi:hypothetical protein